MQQHEITFPGQFQLESGEVIESPTVRFHTFGTFDPTKNNVVWVCHALTANSDVESWWSGLFGAQKLFNPKEHFVVCANVLGSCYGTTGPTSPRSNRRPLLDAFPHVTTRDMARLHNALRRALSIDKIHVLIGGSLGGQQALEWSILHPQVIEHLVLVATNARHSAYGIAFNESQRLAIYADSTYGNGNLNGGTAGLIAARSIAMLSYRSYSGYVSTQTELEPTIGADHAAASYQRYQGVKLTKRFNAYAYVTLSRAMDDHNVARGRRSLDAALHQVAAKTLVIGITSDQLFPLHEQEFLSRHIPGACFHAIESRFGHDGFLIETEALHGCIEDFLHNDFSNFKHTTFRRLTLA